MIHGKFIPSSILILISLAIPLGAFSAGGAPVTALKYATVSSIAAAAVDITAISPPNFVVILVDDLGYGDVGFNGSDEIDTPHLDRLAADGLVFTDFHSNGSVCSPTRAALLTGRYQHRSGVVNVLGQTGNAMRIIYPDDPFVGLEPEEITIAERLKEAGYVTGCFGKWHLGPLETHGPNRQGFDVFVGVEGLPYNDFTYVYNGIHRLYRGDHLPVPDEGGTYFTYLLADEVCDFMAGNVERPFFAYVPFTAPHIPLWGPDDADLEWDETNRYGPREDPQEAYYDVVEALDEAVGRIMECIDELGLAENTLVFFSSDNGPIDFGSTEPWRGRKSNLFEGATRVPTIFSWPGVIPSGKTDELALTMDLKPTFLGLAGLSPQEDYPLDGVDLFPLLSEGRLLGERMVFWEKPNGVQMFKFDWRRFAVRDGQWKLVDDGRNMRKALFDLERDPTESENVSDRYPDRVERMHEAFLAWKADVYADAPYDMEETMKRLEEAGILRQDSRAME